MKPHIVVGVYPEARKFGLGSWLELLHDKSVAADSPHPDITRLLRKYRSPVFAVSEYAPAKTSWTPEEVASGLDSIYRLILREGRRIPDGLVDDIRLLPFVRFARAGRIARTDLPVAEMSFRDRGVEASRAAIGLEDAHEYSQGDRSIRVGVLDTGVAADHKELADAMAPGFDAVNFSEGMDSEALRDFVGDLYETDLEPADEVGHGTHVSGIIAGQGRQMPIGVVPKCRIVPVRALAAMQGGGKRTGAGLEDNINVAAKWAIDEGVDVLNMSLGIRHEGGGLPHREVVDYARRKGVTIVAASGNDGRKEMYYPGALPYVIAVGAADRNKQVALFSTFGDQVSLIAPGTDIYSSYLDDRYATSSGTSQAAPFVAGAVALLKSFGKSLGRRLSDSQIKHVLKHTADRVDTSFKHPKAGFGHLNLADALRLLEYRLAV